MLPTIGSRCCLPVLGALALLVPLLAVVRPPAPVAAVGVVTECTEAALRAAVSGGGTISFACTGTITLTSQLEINQDTVIDGGGSVTLAGNYNYTSRLIMVPAGAALTLNNLTLYRGGRSITSGLDGGAVANYGRLTINSSTLSNNVGYFGGAIFNRGELTIRDSQLVDNKATFAGAIDAGGTVTIIGSTLTGNVARNSGGGAIKIGLHGTVLISNSTLAGNYSEGLGGAIFNDGHLTLSASTLADNHAKSGSAIVNNVGVVVLSGSILSGSGLCSGSTSFTSNGYNVASDNSCNLTAAGDVQGVDPQLSRLSNNGGQTLTMLPQRGSPALDRVPNQLCAELSAVNGGHDQRGGPRPVGDAACDSGSVEVSPAEWCAWKTGRSPELIGWEC